MSTQDQWGVKGKDLKIKPQTAGRPVKHESGTENKGTKVVVKRAGK